MPTRLVLAALLAVLGPVALLADQPVRLAQYNIRMFTTEASTTRLGRLAAVLDDLRPDVVALQEIADRAALERLFNKDRWYLIIDDESKPATVGDRDQDLALAARKDRFELVDFKGQGENADDGDFLFPQPEHDELFRSRRDVLRVTLRVRGTQPPVEFTVLVQHCKSRLGGRSATDPLRERAAELVAAKLKADYAGKLVAFLGDFNDNPDDRSVNILETGDAAVAGGPSSQPATLLVNLTEPLLAEDRVTHGPGPRAIDAATGRINTVDPGSRERNHVNRGNDVNTGHILFDQILVSPPLAQRYVAGSTRVYDGGLAVLGPARDSASDHLPVAADFTFPGDAPPPGAGSLWAVAPATAPASGPASRPARNGNVRPGRVRIAALLPNPAGPDNGNETATLANDTDQAVELAGWTLVGPRASFELAGTLKPGDRLTVVLGGKFVLNNQGQEVRLLNAAGDEVHKVSYEARQADDGQQIAFPAD